MRPALYLDEWTVDAGSRILVRASGDGAATARLVRLRGLVGAGVPTGYREEPIGAATALTLQPRDVPSGSYAYAETGPSCPDGRGWCWTLRVFPTLVDRGDVLEWGTAGARLSVADGALHGRFGSAAVAVPLDHDAWSEVRLSWAPATGLDIVVEPVGPGTWLRAARRARGEGGGGGVAGPIAFGRGFSGKIESPTLAMEGAVVAHWNFAGAMTTQTVPGTGAAALALVNAPRRGVTGSRWDGTAHDWTTRPSHYEAIHFHDDDLADCLWPADAVLRLPEEAPSGIFAVRLESEDGVRHTPVFVRPRRKAEIAFLASTFSYLAYGNSIWDSRVGTPWEAKHKVEADAARRFGRSAYCRHRDGSGIGLVSSRRPILSFTPGFVGEAIGGQVLLNDDLRIVAWLDRVGQPYDVVTDHDLHGRGPGVLDGYRVLVTGAHPEYHSRQTLAAIEQFTDRGGRLMYLGGNGFYWRVTTLPDAPHVLEVRRAEGGIRTWAEPPGEYVHQSDGALGGLWRRLGRPPNRLVGIGYSAQGSEDDACGYLRTEAAADARARFLFEGVTAPVIGAQGPTGGAVGYELDRADPALGTPPHTLVVARSQPVEGYGPVNEERLTDRLLTAHDPLRADMTFFEGPNGGAVFAVGSVLFAGSLDEADGAARIATNCLTRFADAQPFAPPHSSDPPIA